MTGFWSGSSYFGDADPEFARGTRVREQMLGRGGDDTLFGAAGNDFIEGNDGSDVLVGGAGDDEIYAGYRTPFLSEGAGADTLYGGKGNDWLSLGIGLAGDVVRGGEGIDALVLRYPPQFEFGAVAMRIELSTAFRITFDGAPTVVVSGVERLFATTGDGDDVLVGGEFDDYLSSGAGDDTLDAKGGNDTVNVGSGRFEAHGGAGTDELIVDLSAEAGGVALIFGETFTVGASQGDGFEILQAFGGAGADTIAGAAAADTLLGEGGADVVSGGGGDDLLDGRTGADRLDGGDGRDRLIGAEGDDTVIGGAGRDLLNRLEFVIDYPADVDDDLVRGGGGADTIDGGYGSETLRGGSGDDLVKLDPDRWVDRVDGGAGDDELDVWLLGEAPRAPVAIVTDDVGGVTIVRGARVIVEATSIERLDIRGGSGADSMRGGAGDDTIIGGRGHDTLDGGDGSDVLELSDIRRPVTLALAGAAPATVFVDGVAEKEVANFENVIAGLGADVVVGDAGANRLDGWTGDDTLTGGDGADTFVFFVYLQHETITDFVSGEDTIELPSLGFFPLRPGALGDAAFALGASATDADDRVVYDPATGTLRYDADGTGEQPAYRIATLEAAPTLTAADILVTNPSYFDD